MNELQQIISEADDKNGIIDGVDASRLLSYIERVERLQEEKKALQNDIKEVFEEAKAAKFEVKAIKEILKARKEDETERQEKEFIVDVYKRALGMD